MTPEQKDQLIALFNSGNFEELEIQARTLIERHPDSGFAWSILGGALSMQGKDALIALQKTAQLAPADAAAHSNLGNALMDCGRADEAVASYRRALEIQPDLVQAHSNLGQVLRTLGQFEEAVASCRRAIEIKPDFADAHFNLGNALSDLGQLDDAVLSYRRAVEIKSDFLGAQYCLASGQRALGRLDEAAASYRRVLEMKPDLALAHCELGAVLEGVGQLDHAIASLRQAVAIEPDFVQAHYSLGIVLFGLARFDEAAVSFRRALAIKPDFAEAHFSLGAALRGIGNYDEAAASYRRTLDIKPDDAAAHRCLGVVLSDLKQFDGALASYQRALEIQPDCEDVYGLMGGVLRTQGKLGEALACFEQQVRITPDDSVAQHMLASLSERNTECAPRQYVEGVFDGYANKFDTHLQNALGYDTPQKLVAFMHQHQTPPVEKWSVLDLGCGTGLLGQALVPYARHMVGVDLSSKMLEKARARNIYARLEHLDLLTMMQAEQTGSYDAVVAADVFIYVGKLDEVMREIKRLVRHAGIVAFSIEFNDACLKEKTSPGATRDYKLEKTGRYSHFPDYITKLALANGFTQVDMKNIQIRMEGGVAVEGKLVVLKS